MGWFDSYSVNTSDPDIAIKNNDGKLYKIIQLVAVLLLILPIALFIFSFFHVFDLNVTGSGVLISIMIVGIGGLNGLPWVRIFERIKDKRFRIMSIVFMALVGVVVVLWLVCAWQIIAVVDKALSNPDGDELVVDVINIINTMRGVFIASLQIMIASAVATNIVKYRKTMMVYQALNGAALLYMDFYISLLMTAITVNSDIEPTLSATAGWIISPVLGALFFVALIILGVVGSVFTRAERRRLIATANEAAGSEKSSDSDKKFDGAASADTESEADKFKKLQELYDSGMITKEEFEQKRAEILNRL